jgi:hypothetical protein
MVDSPSTERLLVQAIRTVNGKAAPWLCSQLKTYHNLLPDHMEWPYDSHFMTQEYVMFSHHIKIDKLYRYDR